MLYGTSLKILYIMIRDKRYYTLETRLKDSSRNTLMGWRIILIYSPLMS